MDMDSGINLRLSAAKADDHPFQQSRRQVLDSTREARLACVVARAHAQEADYEAFAVCRRHQPQDRVPPCQETLRQAQWLTSQGVGGPRSGRPNACMALSGKIASWCERVWATAI